MAYLKNKPLPKKDPKPSSNMTKRAIKLLPLKLRVNIPLKISPT